jgi:hypothetical protein
MIYTNKEIKAKAHEYIDTQLARDINWMSTITDSWIYDAESWFVSELEKIGQIYKNETEYDYTDDVDKQVKTFWKYALAYKEKKFVELYWEQTSKSTIRAMIYQLQKYKSATKELKKMIGHKNDQAVSDLCLSEKKIEEYENCLLGAHAWLCSVNTNKKNKK